APERPVQYAQLAEANEAHPVPHSSNERPVPQPSTSSNATYTAVLPPLTVSAHSPPPPPGATAGPVLLVGEAHRSPAGEFSSTGEPPEFAKAMSHALGEGAAPTKQKTSKQPAATVAPNPPPAAATETASAAAEPTPAPEPQKRRGG